MLRWIIRFALLALAWQAASTQAGQEAPLKLGIMPFNSTLALIKTHQPLRQFLQNALGRPVEIFTAADYAQFHRDSLNGVFDLLITGPHFGVMTLQHGYAPLFHYKTRLRPVFVIRKDSGIGQAEALRGKRIGLSNRLSVSSIVGLKWMADRGMQAGRDFQVLERTTHGAAIAGVAVGDLDAALTTYTPLKQVPEDVRAKVGVLPTDVDVPHLMTLAHGRLGDEFIGRLREALRRFPTTPEGQVFFLETGYEGYEPITSSDVMALQPYVPIVREMMGR